MTDHTRRSILAAAAALALGSQIATSARAGNATPGATPANPASNDDLRANGRLVAEAADAMFNHHDPAAVDRYVSPAYTQHSTLIGDGPEALRELIAGLGEGVSHKTIRLIADRDLVAVHGVYTGFGETPLVAFDLYRVADGRLVEHWDGLTPQTPVNPSGHTQTDGPTEARDLSRTDPNRSLVEGFVDAILIGGQVDRLTEFIDPTTYTQHNSQIADGLDGLGAALEALATQGLTLVYNARHRTVADGDLVLVQSDGDFGGPVVYYDLFRVEKGLIVEHWDVIQSIPAEIPHDNGLF